MKTNMGVEIDSMEGRTYIVGREGHVYIDSPTVSKHHAELKIINGRVYLRDLNSANGTFLLKGNSLVVFDEGYVNPLQSIVIGGQKHTIMYLLAKAKDFAASDDATTQIDIVNWKLNSRRYG